MIILMKGTNEEKVVNRCLSDFHDCGFVDKVIVIDGGSTDYTVQELRRFSKVQVFIHPWLDWYHDMEVCQSNIALSYVPHGGLCFILDFDERMSEELKTVLSQINAGASFPFDIGNFSRRTMDVLRYEGSPHAIIGDDGWPIEANQSGQYPDWQCRLIRRKRGMHWINSPHHVLHGYESYTNIEADILHYEKDDLRDRERIEKKWLRSQVVRKKLGLVADVFECTVKPELHKYMDPGFWG